MNELALFSGAGGGILAGSLLGWKTVCAVECDSYPAQVLAQRQNDGLLEPFPIWSDLRSFDGKPWRSIVDVISGGFPCQDISVAGKGEGIAGERSGLWTEMARVVCEVRPKFVFVENSPILTSRGLGVVLGDLASIGYDAEWVCLSAEQCGAPHKRDRIWILAHTNSEPLREEQKPRKKCEGQTITSNNGNNGNVTDTNSVRQLQQEGSEQEERGWSSDGDWWAPKPPVCGVDDGVAHRMDRLKALGNGQVAIVAAKAFNILKSRIDNE